MPTHTTDDILRAPAASAWSPRDSDRADEHLTLVRYPALFGGGMRGSQVRSSSAAATVLDHAVDRARTWGESS